MNFTTPMIIISQMSWEEISIEVEKAVLRDDITNAWLNNQISTNDFLDLLDQQQIDVYDLVETWESGLVLI